ncbi:MarR family winged helix-turn-helix transcriptional regulator [Zavarzinia sp. CC-PAN008]|uniref:MarR family winged helix-turn-helix transcriptional regulator n=1 Tax=Zavarzinia sp. CC-PAN008 TaxID=3243332 RepID=UPI003F744B69
MSKRQAKDEVLDDGAASGAAPPGATPEQLRLDNQLCFALYSASSALTRAYRPILDPLGLTYPQYLALLALWEESPRSVGSLGQALGLDFGTLSPLLKRLEAGGLISRTRDPKDERRVIVELTARGWALRDKAAEVPGLIFCRLGLPVEDLLELREKLNALASTLHRPGAD